MKKNKKKHTLVPYTSHVKLKTKNTNNNKNTKNSKRHEKKDIPIMSPC